MSDSGASSSSPGYISCHRSCKSSGRTLAVGVLSGALLCCMVTMYYKPRVNHGVFHLSSSMRYNHHGNAESGDYHGNAGSGDQHGNAGSDHHGNAGSGDHHGNAGSGDHYSNADSGDHHDNAESGDHNIVTSHQFRNQLDCDDVENDKVANRNYLTNYRSQCWVSESPRASCLQSLRTNSHFLHSPNKYGEYMKALATVIKRSDKYVRCLPYAFLAGFPKCGTTDLYDKLMEHPHILTTSQKEGHYWAKRRFKAHKERRHHGSRRPTTFNQYLQHYDVAAAFIKYHKNSRNFHEDIFVDGSASTLWFNRFWPRVPENRGLAEPKQLNLHDINTWMPDVKVIVMMRNPTDRLFSGFTYFGSTFSRERFHEAVRYSVAGMRRCFRDRTRRACAYQTVPLRETYDLRTRIETGLYAIFIKDWLAAFPRERFLFIRLEDYTLDRMTFLNRAAVFLNLDKYPDTTVAKMKNDDKISNSQRTHVHMLNETRILLDEFYAPFNNELAELLGDDGYLWR